MKFLQKPHKATAGTNYIVLQIPEGAILKKVNMNNASKGWQKNTIFLAREETGAGAGLSLLHRRTQVGLRDLSWEGDMFIESPFVFVVGVFFGADASDVLALTVGYEMPAPRRGWW